MKRIKIWMIIFMIVIFSMITAITVWLYYHPTSYKYNDRFVLGNHASVIIEKYGEFDAIFAKTNESDDKWEGWYLVEDKLYDPDEEYYIIYFVNNIAVRVEINGYPGG